MSKKGVQYVGSRRQDGFIPVQRPEQHVWPLKPELAELSVVPALLGQLQPLATADTPNPQVGSGVCH